MHSFEVTHLYPDFDQQKFWDFLVDHEWYSKSSLMPGEITLERPGEHHSHGVGAVRRIKIGSIDLVEDIVGSEAPGYLAYAVRDGGMPVNAYRGETFLEQRGDGLHLRYRGTFERKFFGTGWLATQLFRSRIQKMIPMWAAGYEAYHGVGRAA